MEYGGEVRGTCPDGHRIDEKARKELLGKMISLREPKQKTEANPCKDTSTLN